MADDKRNAWRKADDLGRKMQEIGCAIMSGCLAIVALVLIAMWFVSYLRGS